MMLDLWSSAWGSKVICTKNKYWYFIDEESLFLILSVLKIYTHREWTNVIHKATNTVLYGKSQTMDVPLVLQTVPVPQDWTTQALLEQVWNWGLVPAAMQFMAPLLLAVHEADPVGVAVADTEVVVVVLTVVVLVVVVEVVVEALLVVVVGWLVVVVVEPPPLQVPVLMVLTTARSSPLSLATSQTMAPANPLQRARLTFAASDTVSS